MSNQTVTPSVGAAAFAGAAPGNFVSSAFLWLTEFKAPVENPVAPTYPTAPSLADQVIAYGASIAAQSSPFTAQTRLVRVQATAVCAIKIGKGATASAGPVGGTTRMASGQTEYFAVHPGDQLSVITAS